MTIDNIDPARKPTPGATVFIDNINPATRPGTIWKLFDKFGQIVGIRLPKVPRIRTKTRYGFVEYMLKADADQAILATNGMMVDESELQTQTAIDRRFIPGAPPPRWIPKTQETQTDSSHQRSPFSPCSSTSPSPNVHAQRFISLEPSLIMKGKLARSIVVSLPVLTSLRKMEQMTQDWGLNTESIVSLSPSKYILIFITHDEAEEFVHSNLGKDLKWDKRVWRCEDQLMSRSTSIAVRGLPLNAWTETAIRAVTRHLGCISQISSDMLRLPKFVEVHATIETTRMSIINEEVKVEVEGCVYNVGIIEYWSEELSQHSGDIDRDPPSSPEHQQERSPQTPSENDSPGKIQTSQQAGVFEKARDTQIPAQKTRAKILQSAAAHIPHCCFPDKAVYLGNSYRGSGSGSVLAIALFGMAVLAA